MKQQTITLPSGITVHIQVEEARPLEQWTDVEIHQQIESLRIERRKVQYRKDEEAVHVRATATEETKRLRAELSRRKREGVECPACGGVGTCGLSPDGDHLYCECEKGIHFHLDAVDGASEAISDILRLNEPMMAFDLSVLEERLAVLIAEHDRLIGLLELLGAR